jgi:ADP-heptose:LPS heptosyltransferase
VRLKQVERAWKALCLRGATRLMRSGTPPGPPPRWDREPTRILFLRQDRIGDAIVSSGLLRAIRGVSPQLTIDALASPVNARVLARDPSVSEVYVFDKRQPRTFPHLVRMLRRRRYDAVIDCMVTAPSMTGLMLMIASGAKHRVGIRGRGVDSGLTIPVDLVRGRGHIIDLLASFGGVFGIDRQATDWRPTIHLRPEEVESADTRWPGAGEERGTRLLVNVSAGRWDRSWPDERFIAAISHLGERFTDLDVAVVGAPSEFERVRSVAAATGTTALDTPRIDDVMGLVATADLVFTPDTSVAHMASAFRTPALVMFQDPDTATLWGLYESPGVDLVGHVSSLGDLPLDQVLPELEALVESVAARRT